VRGREGQHVAFSFDRFGAEQEGGEVRWVCGLGVFCLLFLDCAVVVYEDECALIRGVGVALGAMVARAEVAFWIVLWELGLARLLLGASANVLARFWKALRGNFAQ
jgi:hypothetical protein